jgi:hypothetical protein
VLHKHPVVPLLLSAKVVASYLHGHKNTSCVVVKPALRLNKARVSDTAYHQVQVIP